jgi:hypothetical protein
MIKGFPQFEHTFDFNVQGSETKQNFMGSFTYVRPDIGTSSEIEKYKTRLDGDLANIDKGMSFLHKMLSHLRYTFTDSPKWWEESNFGLKLYDVNIVSELYKIVMKFEDTFMETLPEEVEKHTAEKSKEK